MILPISASQIARIRGMNYRHQLEKVLLER
jgi:hypothetical protein